MHEHLALLSMQHISQNIEARFASITTYFHQELLAVHFHATSNLFLSLLADVTSYETSSALAYEVLKHYPLFPMIVHLAWDECQQCACRNNCSHLWLKGAFQNEGCPNS